tara:strand:- start:5373 stop:5495 length:123 start_codon:yes stop_codon:yes gene_type:complete
MQLEEWKRGWKNTAVSDLKQFIYFKGLSVCPSASYWRNKH